eukprot:1506572-Prymnesium_polylepis.1
MYVRIGLRSDLDAAELEVTAKPVSEELFALELQSSWTVASHDVARPRGSWTIREPQPAFQHSPE